MRRQSAVTLQDVSVPAALKNAAAILMRFIEEGKS
jgi:hypothetical protein